MYAPRGFSGSELGDVEVIVHDGAVHLFHLKLPNHDRIGHAMSRDGLCWERLPAALSTGDPGNFDDDQLWTMSVTERNGRFFMLYTGLARAEAGRVQRIGLAVSDDLVRWEKRGLVGEADSRWYVADREDAPWVAFRDPKPIFADGRYHALVAARDRNAPFLRAGCVGRIVSEDLLHWEPAPPIFTPRSRFELECPQVFRIGNRYYLTAALIEDRSQRYWIADRLDGPYRAPSDDRLLPPGCYAARVAEFDGRAAIFCMHDVPGRDPSKPAYRDRVVPAPLWLDPREDGSLVARLWPRWSDFRDGPTMQLSMDESTPRFGNGRAVRTGATFTSDEGAELWELSPNASNQKLSAELRGDARRTSFVLNADDDGGGLFVELDRAEHRARLVSLRRGQDHDEHPWLARRVLAERTVVLPESFSLELLHVGGELTLSLDGAVVLATVAPTKPGPFGLMVEDGSLKLDRASLTPMREPGPKS